MKLDRTQPYATIVGHESARYQQGTDLFDAQGNLIIEVPAVVSPAVAARLDSRVIETDEVDSATIFLTNVLRGGPLSKAQLFKIAEDNNQPWRAVTQAAEHMGIVKFTYAKSSMWKLPESLGVL